MKDYSYSIFILKPESKLERAEREFKIEKKQTDLNLTKSFISIMSIDKTELLIFLIKNRNFKSIKTAPGFFKNLQELNLRSPGILKKFMDSLRENRTLVEIFLGEPAGVSTVIESIQKSHRDFLDASFSAAHLMRAKNIPEKISKKIMSFFGSEFKIHNNSIKILSSAKKIMRQ